VTLKPVTDADGVLAAEAVVATRAMPVLTKIGAATNAHASAPAQNPMRFVPISFLRPFLSTCTLSVSAIPGNVQLRFGVD